MARHVILAVDSATAGLMHLNLDYIRLTAAPPHNIMSAPLAGPIIVTKPQAPPGLVLKSPVRVYPVPVDDSFTVNLSSMDESDAVMQITGLMGQTILSQSVKAQSTYMFSAKSFKMASNNIYFITIKGKHAYLSFKIILKETLVHKANYVS